MSSPTDTSNFDIISPDFTPCNTQPPNVTAPFTGHHLPFIGFTYSHGSVFSDAKNLAELINSDSVIASVNGQPGNSAAASEQHPSEPVSADPQQSQAAILHSQQPAAGSSAPSTPTSLSTMSIAAGNQQEVIAQLRDEIQILRRRLEDEAQSHQQARPAKDSNVEELEKKLRMSSQ